jgi:hypothetical protein
MIDFDEERELRAAPAPPGIIAVPASSPAEKPAVPAAPAKPAEAKPAAAPKPAAAAPASAPMIGDVQTAPTESSPPSASIKVDWPKAMELNRSDTLTVTLQKHDDGSMSATAAAPNHAAVEATLGPLVPPIISSPGVSAADLDIYALVRLDAPCFKPDARDFDLQPIADMPLTWTFSIVAVCDGTQQIGLTVYTVAISKRSNEQVGQRLPIWRKMLTTEVSSPWITLGQSSVMTLVSGVAGALLGKIPLGKLASDVRDRLTSRARRTRPRRRQPA